MPFQVEEELTNMRLKGKGYKVTFYAKNMIKRVDKGVTKAFKSEALKLKSAIAARCPVDTGRLQDSIDVNVVSQGQNPRITVRTVYYGKFVEEGTSKMSARPFIKSAVFDFGNTFKKEVAKISKAVIERGRAPAVISRR